MLQINDGVRHQLAWTMESCEASSIGAKHIGSQALQAVFITFWEGFVSQAWKMIDLQSWTHVFYVAYIETKHLALERDPSINRLVVGRKLAKAKDVPYEVRTLVYN